MNNKMKLRIIIPVCAIVLLLGGTYAWYAWQTSSDEETIIATDTGYAKVFFDGGDDVTGKLKPVLDKSKGMSKQITVSADKVFIEPITFNLYLDINSIDEGLKHESFKFELYKDGTKIKEGNFSDSYLTSYLSTCETNTGVSHITLVEDTVTTEESVYTLYTWIDGNMSNPLSMAGKNFDFTIHAEGQNAITEPPFSIDMPNLQEGSLAYNLVNTYNRSKKEEVINNEITYYYDRPNRLMSDIAGNLRFFGADDTSVSDDLKNYIYFNCTDYSEQSSDTCELWRIVGVFDGKVKIMRNSIIGNLAWDHDKNNGEGATTYNNDWSNSSLQEFLNGKYYDRGETTTLDYYSGSSGGTTTTLNLESIGIKDGTRELIAESLWYLRGYTRTSVYSDVMYDKERNTGIVKSGPTTMPGYIALPYASDYGYAADFASCTVNLSSYNNTSCTSTNWMKNVIAPSYGWLMAPGSSDSDFAWSVFSSGRVDTGYHVSYAYGVAPVLHLNSELGIEAGDGSQDTPYQLSVN